MKIKHIIALIIVATFFSCNKVDTNPNNISSTGGSEEPSMRILGDGVKIAERMNGQTDCSLDDDILDFAIATYFGPGTTIKSHGLGEYKKKKSCKFYVLEGKAKKGIHIIQYAFEVVPVKLKNGDFEYFLPFDGVVQSVRSKKGTSGKLKLTSSTTGHMKNGNNSSKYTKAKFSAYMHPDQEDLLVLERIKF